MNFIPGHHLISIKNVMVFLRIRTHTVIIKTNLQQLTVVNTKHDKLNPTAYMQSLCNVDVNLYTYMHTFYWRYEKTIVQCLNIWENCKKYQSSDVF